MADDVYLINAPVQTENGEVVSGGAILVKTMSCHGEQPYDYSLRPTAIG